MRSPPLNEMSPSTTVPAPIRLSMRFCGGEFLFRFHMTLSSYSTTLRLARGLAWPDSKARTVTARTVAPGGTSNVPSIL